MNKIHKNTGFTLIELMIVIAIIAILITYALPAYRNYIIKTKAAEGLAVFASVKSSVEIHFSKVGNVSGLNNNTFTILAANDYIGANVQSISVNSGIATINFSAADPVLTGNTITMSPILPGNGINSGNGLMWDCSSSLPQTITPC